MYAALIPFCITAQTGGDARITILQTTDLHHHANGADHTGMDVDPTTGTGSTGGYARIAAYVNHVRANATNPVLLVDSGDWTMGTLYDLTLSSRALGLLFLDLMKYDCVALGNHEFDYSPKGLAQILGAAQSAFGFRTPIVASNMSLGGNADLAPWVGNGKAIQSTRVQDLPNGLRVGYIGLMGKDAALAAPASAPVSFADISANYAGIQSMVDSLRNTQGVQVVIALSHSGTDASGTGGEDTALAAHVHGIDVIASGHTHTPLASAHSVTHAGWTTQIIDAGAYGTNVARIDLTYHAATNSTTMDSSSSVAMTDAGLSAVQGGLAGDPAMAAVVQAADQQLNSALGSFFTQTFPDYDRTKPAKGIYHPVGTAAQDMAYNAGDPVRAPNGLGNLVADAVRGTANGIIAQTPPNLSGYDYTPIQAAVVASGVLRGQLRAGVPLSFADVYNVSPLGITPDSSQALPVGYPLVSAYLELADVKTLCALQLAAQSNLAPGDYYLNISGFKYGLKTAETYTYFKYATAAGVLQTTSQKAAGGSLAALQALSALAGLAQDNGAALLAAYGGDNPFAGAMVKLNDANPSLAQIGANLAVLGQLGAAAAADAAAGTSTATALVVAKALAAIDVVSGFGAADAANTGAASGLSGTSRIRVATDLFAILALGSVQAQFGVTVTVYKSSTGTATLSAADFAGILANRIDAAPASAGVQELKGWMALLSYLQTGLRGTIPPAYASSSDFSQFPRAGAAVQTRNASYPLAGIDQLVGTLSGLAGAPRCASAGAPSIAAVTNPSYGASLSAMGTIIVWGSGFSATGGNSIGLTRPGAADSVWLDARAGSYFWDLSAQQINTKLPAAITAGEWLLSVKNACGASSADFPITVQ